MDVQEIGLEAHGAIDGYVNRVLVVGESAGPAVEDRCTGWLGHQFHLGSGGVGALVRQLARHLNALTDIVPHRGEGDAFLIHPDKNPNTTGAVLLGVAPPTPGAHLARMRDGFCRNDLRSLVVIGEDAAAVLGEHLLERLDLLVVSDVLPTPTTAAAHFLLPGCAHAEKAGSFINAYGRVQRFEPAIAPPGDAQPEWQFLRELVIAVTGQTPPDSVVGLFDALARETSALAGLTWSGLGASGQQISTGPPSPVRAPGLQASGNIVGRVP